MVKTKILMLVGLPLWLTLTPVNARASGSGELQVEVESPKVAIGLNVGMPLVYAVASSTFSNSSLTVIPVEAHLRLGPRWGIAGTLLYRSHTDGALEVNEMAGFLGPRFSLSGTGTTGAYVALKLGFGFAAGNDYYDQDYKRTDIVIQPEIGYARAWSSLYLAVGIGILSLLPLSEEPDVEWNSTGRLIHYYTPAINVTLGFAR